jgi:RNA polymerase sigma-70 factor (ECF subfamily)
MDRAQLVRAHAAAVYGLCRAMVRDAQLAEDLAQDTFARAFAALGAFRGEASPRTWLLKIARNRCLDHLAHVKRAPWGPDPDPDPDDHALDAPLPYELMSDRETATRALAVLGESERALVVLHYGHGVDYVDLAMSFGIGQGAVRMRVSRALAKMRDAITPEAETATLEELDFSTEHNTNEMALAHDDLVAAPATYAFYEHLPPTLWANLHALALGT